MKGDDAARGLSVFGRLVALVTSGQQPIPANDTASVRETVSATVRRAQEVIALRISDDHAHNVAVDLTDGGNIVLSVSGPPSFGEMGVGRTAQTLVQYLNWHGAAWSTPVDVSRNPSEAAVDSEARGPNGELLRIQVVRVDVTQSLWRALSEAGQLRARYTVPELAKLVTQAVESKIFRGSSDLVLALDAGILASHAFRPVAEEVRNKLLSTDAPYGFASVWLVGPSVSLVWQLA